MHLQDKITKINSSINDCFIFIPAELGRNEVLMINCHFIKNIYENHLLSFSSTSKGSVQFVNCTFINNYNVLNMIYNTMHNTMQIGLRYHVKNAIIKVYSSVRTEFEYCYFHADSETDSQVLQTYGSSTYPLTVVIKNTTFSYKRKTYQNEHWYVQHYNIGYELYFIVTYHITIRGFSDIL